MLAPVRTIDPTAALVSLNDAKLHCRVDGNDEDALITNLVLSAVSYLDGYSGILGRALITQTWRVDYAAFEDLMRLPVGNLISVLAVTYYDVNNAQQTLADTVYSSLSDTGGPFIGRKANQSWPATYTRPDAVRVTWTAGYGAAAANVPMPIRQAVLLLVGHWYENRATVNVGNIVSAIPFTVDALLAPFRRSAI